MARNLYARPDELRDNLTITSLDTTDDTVILRLLENVSRYMDTVTARQFYPYIATKSYDVPEGKELWLEDDLLVMTTLTNGDDVAIAAADYVLLPGQGIYPKHAVKIRDSSDESWETDSDNSAEQVIDVLAIWGYHQDYTNAWRSLTTLSAAITTTTATTFTAPTGYVKAGMLVKVDSEYMHVDKVAIGSTTDTVTVQRGANGSTAATHLISTAVYYWEYQLDITQAALDIAVNLYRRRYGENTSGTATVTAVGVVVTPRDVPEFAMSVLRKYQRLVQ